MVNMKDSMEVKKSRAAEIYRSLKVDIIYLRLKPGEMLTEQYLADIYKTSKTPVREALMRLSAENFITVLPHKGYMVTNIPYSDLHDLSQYRSILECACIEHAAQYATEENLNYLESLSPNLRAYHEEKPFFSDSNFSNSDFHIYLAEISGNRFLMKSLVNVIEQLQRFLWYSTTESVVDDSIAQHYAMVELIREKRVAEAQALMRRHIQEVFQTGMERKNMYTF